VSDPVRIAVDAMGGDRAPEVIVQGCLEALSDYDDVVVHLVGREADVRPLLGGEPERLEVVAADDVIGMDEHPGQALRKKPGASIAVAAKLLKDGVASALVSAGNTGAVIGATMFAARRLPGVHRPGIAVTFPTSRGPTVLCDAGANIHCKPEHYVHYALMASAYAEEILGVESPRVALLNIGTEESKGSDELRVVRQQLQAASGAGLIRFTGAVEGNHIFEGEADVVVCDGFVGNTVLKCAEGSARAVVEHLASLVGGRPAEEQPALKRVLGQLVEYTHYSEYGGAPLLGIDGCAIIAHGRSDARAIKNAIRVARDFARRGVNERIVARLGELTKVVSS
jgi:glycerol-3-phosphate acyltransferase PlsX